MIQSTRRTDGCAGSTLSRVSAAAGLEPTGRAVFLQRRWFLPKKNLQEDKLRKRYLTADFCRRSCRMVSVWNTVSDSFPGRWKARHWLANHQGVASCVSQSSHLGVLDDYYPNSPTLRCCTIAEIFPKSSRTVAPGTARRAPPPPTHALHRELRGRTQQTQRQNRTPAHRVHLSNAHRHGWRTPEACSVSGARRHADAHTMCSLRKARSPLPRGVGCDLLGADTRWGF